MAQAAEQQNRSFLISTFYLGDTLLGIDTLRVQEIIRVIDVTKVYQAPDYIIGVLNLRGRIVTIVDLARKLSLPQQEMTGQSRIIIVDWNGEYMGLLVSAVSDVVTADREGIVPPPSNVKGAQGRYFQGMYRTDKHLIAILDVEEILSVEEK